MNQINATKLLQTMQDLAQQAKSMKVEPAIEKGSFHSLLSSAITRTNDIQKTASTMADKYERGDSQTDLSDVMISLQKANISFQALTQVRNRIVSAYQDIMNMHI